MDKRIQETNEVFFNFMKALLGIRIIKYMAWEPQFIKKIRLARENELASRFKLLLGNMAVYSIAWASSLLVTFTSFFFYTVVAGNQLDAATAFTSISLLETVSFSLSSVSELVSEILNVKVTMDRVKSFLDEPDMPKFSNENENTYNENVGFQNGDFTYHETTPNTVETENTAERQQHTFVLRNLNVEFPAGKVTAVVGATGSGKTSLLAALLGEMKVICGTYQLPNSHLYSESFKSDVAYVSQTAWLMNASVRDNILFGETYSEERYKSVISACALLRDFETLPGGDLTEIGEKGVNLSGGQKQRVSLARAAYSMAPVVLLDDPLSAVDAPTARFLFNKCILGILKGRTILLVSHAIDLVIPMVDYVVLLDNGEIISKGTPKEISLDPLATSILIADAHYQKQVESASSKMEPSTAFSKGVNIIEPERKLTGRVKLSTYMTYFKACGGMWFLIGLLSVFTFQVLADYLSNWWIEVWTDSINSSNIIENLGELQINSVGEFVITNASKYSYKALVSSANDWAAKAANDNNSAVYHLAIFGLIGFAELFAMQVRQIMNFMGGLNASRKLHDDLLVAVMRSPLRFFETTPVGRIINRFSKDMTDIDITVIFTSTRFGMLIFGAVIRICIVGFVAPPFLSSVLLFYVYYRIADYYLQTSREIKRIESVSSSPIYAQFGETLQGASTIRAYGAEYQVTREIELKVDSNHRAYFYLFATNQWLLFRTVSLSGLIIFGAGAAILSSNVSAGYSIE